MEPTPKRKCVDSRWAPSPLVFRIGRFIGFIQRLLSRLPQIVDRGSKTLLKQTPTEREFLYLLERHLLELLFLIKYELTMCNRNVPTGWETTIVGWLLALVRQLWLFLIVIWWSVTPSLEVLGPAYWVIYHRNRVSWWSKKVRQARIQRLLPQTHIHKDILSLSSCTLLHTHHGG